LPLAVLFTRAATVLFHKYWALPADQQLIPQLLFFKNIAVVGGLSMLAAWGPGARSVERRGRAHVHGRAPVGPAPEAAGSPAGCGLRTCAETAKFEVEMPDPTSRAEDLPMSQPDKPPVTARPASTVVILRDEAAGIEVFMVVRHHEIDFASGALVYPGGKVDPQDSDPRWARLAPVPVDVPEPAYWVAAARETFEEAGLLLARNPEREGRLVLPERAHRLVERYQKPLNAGEISFCDIIERENLMLATDLMVHFAHWITPVTSPKRFDTQFFLVAAPMEQLGAHDGSESVEGIWIRPQQALDDAEAGRRTLVNATRMNLQKLATSHTVSQAVQAARSAPVVTVLPQVRNLPDGSRLIRIPEEAGYGVSEVHVPAHIRPAAGG